MKASNSINRIDTGTQTTVEFPRLLDLLPNNIKLDDVIEVFFSWDTGIIFPQD